MAREPNKKTVDRLLELLYRELSSSPRKLRRVTGAAGVNRNYPVERRAAGTMDLAKLCALVEANGEDFASFVARALAPEGGSDLLERPEGEEPAILEKARRRAGEETPGSIPRSHLEALDDLRYDDPAKAREGVEAAISFIDPADVPFALGVYASCSHSLLQMPEAWMAISEGFRLVDHRQQAHTQANLWQRVSVIHLVQCRFDKALAASERASIAYLRQGSLSGMGQTLVDQGLILWEIELEDQAAECFGQALPLLSSSDQRHLFTAYQSLAFLLNRKGQSEQALEVLTKAVPYAHSHAAKGKLQWVEGLCLEKIGRETKALQSFEDAFQLLKVPTPADAALLTCNIVRLLLRMNRPGEALEKARALGNLVVLLQDKSDRVAAAARDLAMVGLESQQRLTLGFVRSIEERIEGARRRKPAGSKPAR